MSTRPETAEFILNKLGGKEFTIRAMFGEYALYVEEKVVAFICDDLLLVKIVPASSELESQCEKGEAYPGSKPYYVVEESQISTIENLADILRAVAKEVPAPKKKKPKAKK